MDIFFQIGLMFIVSALIALIARLIKQPVIPAYILAGVMIGPVLGIITNSEVITTLSSIGMAFLLFVVGLELNLSKIKDTGFFTAIGGTLQVLLVFIAGFIVSILLGLTRLESTYIGFIVAFSSTIIVVKLLSDRREIDTLHGRIIIGILLVQDIIALFVFSVLMTKNSFNAIDVMFSIAKGAGVFLIAYLSGRFLFPAAFRFAAKSQEMLFLLSLGVCFLFSIALSYLGFSIVIGAFIAGLSLANLPYNIEIIGRVKSLKDFFVTLFFVSLGLGIMISEIRKWMIPLLLLSLVVLLVKPLAIMTICAIGRYTKRNSFLASISLAQISEFSLIIAAQGLLLGHISQELFSLTILLAVITITGTSYLIKFEQPIYSALSRYLSIFDVMSEGEKMEYLPKELEYDFVLVGYDRIGYDVFKMLTKAKKTFVVIDFNPDIIKRLVGKKIPCIYGDIGDSEIMERLNLKKTEFVVSTVPGVEDSIAIIKRIRHENPRTIVFVTATRVEDALKLYKEGADYVVLPHFLGGERVSSMIHELGFDHRQISLTKLAHIHDLKDRIDLRHEHPHA